MSSTETSTKPVEEICVLGKIGAAHGVKGWCHVQSFTDHPADIVDYKTWLIQSSNGWREYKVESKRSNGNKIAVKLTGVNDRDMAIALRGSEIGVPKSKLPALADNEFYWRDLIGLTVIAVDGVTLGTLTGFFETGANDVMVVKDDKGNGEQSEHLIPYAESVVKTVSLTDGRMTVDWDVDY